MSDLHNQGQQNQSTAANPQSGQPQDPNAGGQSGGQQNQQQSGQPQDPNAGDGQQQQGQQQAGQQQGQPFRTFQSQDELNEFMQDRVTRAERSALEKQAKAAGFKSWAHMASFVATVQGEDPQQAAQAAQHADDGGTQSDPQANQGTNEYQRLQMALQVGGDKGLPPALISRLQGNTREELEADADRLVGLVGGGQQQQQGPGIPNAPRQQQPAQFTAEQLSDPEFVRSNMDAIRQAARGGGRR